MTGNSGGQSSPSDAVGPPDDCVCVVLQGRVHRSEHRRRGRQDQVPEQDGSADYVQRHAGQRLPEEKVTPPPRPRPRPHPISHAHLSHEPLLSVRSTQDSGVSQLSQVASSAGVLSPVSAVQTKPSVGEGVWMSLVGDLNTPCSVMK